MQEQKKAKLYQIKLHGAQGSKDLVKNLMLSCIKPEEKNANKN